jgi:hypothetical protein
MRYINFLETVIVSDGQNINRSLIGRSQLSLNDNIDLLWNQEIIFIINILLETELVDFLLD